MPKYGGDTLKFGEMNVRVVTVNHLPVKHAFGLRTAVHRDGERFGKRPVLYYLYAEPKQWSNGRPIPETGIKGHRAEIEQFADIVGGSEVSFCSCSYSDLLASWNAHTNADVHAHATAVEERFAP